MRFTITAFLSAGLFDGSGALLPLAKFVISVVVVVVADGLPVFLVDLSTPVSLLDLLL